MPIVEEMWEDMIQNALEYVRGGKTVQACAAIYAIDYYVRQQVLGPSPLRRIPAVGARPPRAV